MLGFSASKAAMACCVNCARLSPPHQEKRSSTLPSALFCSAPPPQALSARTAAAVAAMMAEARSRRVDRLALGSDARALEAPAEAPSGAIPPPFGNTGTVVSDPL